MIKIMIFSLIILNVIIHQINTQISNIRFLPNSSYFNDDRDGIVLLTLNTGEETTICNYKFTEIEANIVCKSLGFPAHGYSVVNNRQNNIGKVLIGNFKCHGNESHIKDCIYSGRKEYFGLCGEHKMDVHVFCVEKKLLEDKTNQITTCKNEPGMVLQPLSGKVNTGFLQLELNGKMNYICNDQFDFGLDATEFYCNKICKNSHFPRPLMFLDRTQYQININSSFVTVSCQSGQCKHIQTNYCDPSYVIGIKCGDEPVIIEKSPEITCTHERINVTWKHDTIPFINSSLVSLYPVCHNSSMIDTVNGDVILSLRLGDCNPIIKDEENFVSYTYNIIRSYISVGMTLQNPANLIAQCRVIKHSQVSNKLEFKKVTASSLNYKAKITLKMNLFTDGSFTTQMKKESKVEFHKLLFVKVNIENPPKDIKLSLYNCVVSPNEKFNDTDVVYLIQNMCPNEFYDVQLTYLSRTSIGFQFRPFNFVGKQNMPIYIKCETSKCYFPNDKYCGVCNSHLRHARSISNRITESSSIGPIWPTVKNADTI